MEANADNTIGQLLRRFGVTGEPDFDTIARATWPLVRAVLSSEASRNWIATMLSEFYDELPRDQA